MASRAYVDDVVQVAEYLLEQYFVGSQLHGQLTTNQPEAPEDYPEIRVFVHSPAMRPALTVIHGIQLLTDAAALAVEYVEREAFTGGAVPHDALEELFTSQSLVELQITELSTGSFWGRFSINPMTEAGRRRLFAIASLASILLYPVLGPVPSIVLASIGYLKEIATPDKPASAVLPLRTVDSADLDNVGEASVTLERHRA